MNLSKSTLRTLEALEQVLCQVADGLADTLVTVRDLAKLPPPPPRVQVETEAG